MFTINAHLFAMSIRFKSVSLVVDKFFAYKNIHVYLVVLLQLQHIGSKKYVTVHSKPSLTESDSLLVSNTNMVWEPIA